MLKVTCNICKEKDIKTELVSSQIARNETEGLQLIAVEMAKHLERSHPTELRDLMATSIKTNALLCMIMFDSDDAKYNATRENEREDICVAIMKGAPEEEEEEEEDEDDDIFDDDDEDDEVSEETLEDGKDGMIENVKGSNVIELHQTKSPKSAA